MIDLWVAMNNKHHQRKKKEEATPITIIIYCNYFLVEFLFLLSLLLL